MTSLQNITHTEISQSTSDAIGALDSLSAHLAILETLKGCEAKLVLLTTQEVAAILRVSVKKLEADRCRGDGIPYIKCSGTTVRYRLSTVLENLEQNTRSNTCK